MKAPPTGQGPLLAIRALAAGYGQVRVLHDVDLAVHRGEIFGVLGPIAAIWAVLYVGVTLGSPHSATYGMRLMGLQMRTWYGAPMYFVLGAVHAIFFWVLSTALTPLVLLVSLFNSRRRTLHDFLTGTVVINDEARAASLRR